MTSRSLRAGTSGRLLCAAVLTLGLLALPGTALAAPPKAKPPKSKPAKPAEAAKGKAAAEGKAAPEGKAKADEAAGPIDLAAARVDLGGSDVDGAVDAAERLGKSRDPRAAEVLLDALSVGANPRVAAAALDALAILKSPRAVPVLLHFSRNRHPEVRRKALLALAPFREPRVNKAMIVRLGDSTKDVRATAARLIAERKDRAAEPALMKLLRRGDEAAASAIGAIANADTARRLAELYGQVSESLLASALGEFIKRQDVADAIRVDVIRTLGKMPGAEATAALVEYIGSIPANQERASKAEAQKLLDQRSR
ncbi:MAG TPA: HEAT repeat domain-containing protein [Polyangia bacterium]|jgi:HEAT repeat protein